MSHVDFVFPTSVSYNSAGGPRIDVKVIPFSGDEEGNNEVRIQTQSRAIWDYEVLINKISLADSEALHGFFLGRRSKAQSFLFKDFNDYSATGQHLGYGDGTEQTFQLLKHYPDVGSFPITAVSTGSNYFEIDADNQFVFMAGDYFRVLDSTGNNQFYSVSAVSLQSGDTRLETNESVTDATVDGEIQPRYTRIIQKPIISTVKIYQNGVEESSGNITHDTMGNVTFTTNNGEEITADFEFYSVVRFGIGWSRLSRIRPNTNQSVNIPLKGIYLKAS